MATERGGQPSMKDAHSSPGRVSLFLVSAAVREGKQRPPSCTIKSTSAVVLLLPELLLHYLLLLL